MDQFLSRKFIVTVHEPGSKHVSLEASFKSTETAIQRLKSGRLRPKEPPITKLKIAMER